MTRLFLAAATAAAALTVTAAPVAAVDRSGTSSAGPAAGVTVHRGGPKFVADGRRDRPNRRESRGLDGGVYLGDREFQGDTVWRPDSFNDWWHERPLRSQPRWISSNNCERQYWTGGGWRC